LHDVTGAEPRTVASRRSAALLFSILFLALLVFGGLYVQRTSFVLNGQRVYTLWDDAMISMQYARNLREGHGLVWNPGGERIQGFTNPGVTFAMALVHVLPLSEFDMALAFQLLNLVILAGIWVGVWRVSRRVFPGDPMIAAGATVAVSLCAPLAIWSVQGADTGFVSLWMLACIGMIAGAERDRRPWPAACFWLLAAGVAIRPDVTVFTVAILLVALRAGRRDAGRRLAHGGLAIATVGGALAVGSQLYYGDPLPNTWYLKATGAPLALVMASGATQLAPWLLRMLPALALAVAAVRWERARPEVLLCGLPLLAGLAYHVVIGGDWMAHYGSRFAVPALPPFLILVSAGLWRLLQKTLPARRLASAGGGAGLLALVTAATLWLNPKGTTREWFDPSESTMLHQSNLKSFRYASYFRDHTHPSTTLGLHWAGVRRYFSHRSSIDLLGRSDRHIARTEVHEGRFRPGHSKWDWDYMMNVRKPDIVAGESGGLRERADFREAYYLAKGPRRGFYVRKDSVEKLVDDELAFEDLETGRRIPRPRDRDPGLARDAVGPSPEEP
jgi:arabinofuranosyltransferase